MFVLKLKHCDFLCEGGFITSWSCDEYILLLSYNNIIIFLAFYEVKCTKCLKSWVGLPCCATPVVLHIPPFTDIPTIRSLYLQLQATNHASSRIKADDRVNIALDSKVEYEDIWQRKFSI